VLGHEGKCRHVHGHNYRVTFECVALEELDSLGRVVDFGVVKSRLCDWLEEHWDHKFLAYSMDSAIVNSQVFSGSVVVLPFNPTAENMAQFLLRVVAPEQLYGENVMCTRVIVEETRKCSATATLTEGVTHVRQEP
jgi:6-pyruvoyltetrahydropterin/6-carboxytetrahydropterin synthase